MIVVSDASSETRVLFPFANSEIRKRIDRTDNLLLTIPAANLKPKVTLIIRFMCGQLHRLILMEFWSSVGTPDSRTYRMNHSDTAFTFQESQGTADACSGPLLTGPAWGEESCHPATAPRRNWLTSFELKWVSTITWAWASVHSEHRCLMCFDRILRYSSYLYDC